MTRIISGLFLLLQFCSAYAIGEAPPANESSTVGMIVFGVIFFAFCAGFIWMVVKAEKKQGPEKE